MCVSPVTSLSRSDWERGLNNGVFGVRIFVIGRGEGELLSSPLKGRGNAGGV